MPTMPTASPAGGMLSRLKEWATLASQVPCAEDPGVVAGRQAEVFLQQIVGTHLNHRGASLWGGRRVPRRDGGRREIDLIVCSRKMIHLIEVKNWSGQLIDQGRVWQQVRRSGEVMNHANLIDDNLEKRFLVVKYLRDNGIAIDGDFLRRHICQKVIFMNPRLRLPHSISSHPDVITWNSLPGYLGEQSPRKAVERILCSVIDLCLWSEASEIVQEQLYGSMSARRLEAIEAAISRLRTWDQLGLFGTKVLIGDLLKLTIGSAVYVRESLEANVPIQLSWTRGKVAGLLKAITGLGQLGKASVGRVTVPLSPNDTVKFHIVGQKSPTVCKLIDIDNIVLG
jgi:Holliday junction resolvase-like predicted endonuclease